MYQKLLMCITHRATDNKLNQFILFCPFVKKIEINDGIKDSIFAYLSAALDRRSRADLEYFL